MHCSICDRLLSPNEITFNKELGKWEICSTCLDVAYDAAFKGDFKHDETNEEVLLDNDGNPVFVSLETACEVLDERFDEL